ncbi:hypothetical protein CLF_101742 [Clonorchis sinensis]|uniref:F-box domain-containing protein n=1 Tax=Clonorchis sinensis TaxID=79923 RepID=G7Y6G6_CLOSI|nr:hypothetical protein CLF_101742 [Clonorchis sinensis]
MDKLPSEVLFRIFQFLSCEDLRSCALVCRQWSILASDKLLWRRKLTKLVRKQWSVVVCNQPYAIDKKLLGLYEHDPQSFYFRFQRYVPLSLVKQSYVTGPEASVPGANAFKSALLPRFIPHWWNEDERNLLHRSTGGVQGGLNQEYRFAVLGSGLDQNLSTNLFARLLNGRVGPFELLQIFPGRLGYGGGLSLRAHGYAQANVLDTSMRPQEASPPIIADDFQSDDGASPRVSSKRTHIYRHRRSKHHSARSPYVEDALDALSVGSGAEDKNQPKDLVFDLVLLYADMNERHNENKDELRRILTSRLFFQPRAPLTGEQMLFELEFREELDPVMKTINGLIYAVETAAYGGQISSVGPQDPTDSRFDAVLHVVYDIQLVTYTPHIHGVQNVTRRSDCCVFWSSVVFVSITVLIKHIRGQLPNCYLLEPVSSARHWTIDFQSHTYSIERRALHILWTRVEIRAISIRFQNRTDFIFCGHKLDERACHCCGNTDEDIQSMNSGASTTGRIQTKGKLAEMHHESPVKGCRSLQTSLPFPKKVTWLKVFTEETQETYKYRFGKCRATNAAILTAMLVGILLKAK